MEGSFNSHSRTLSSKKGFHNNVNGFTAYDDVFGGPPKFGVTAFAPRADDYSEIFGSFHSSRASSIPILDLPAVDDAVVSFDVRSSNFDYAEVFSGFHAVDFATPFNELFKHSDGGDDVDGGSSEEAWTPVGTVSPSEESDPSAYFGKNHCFQNEAIAPSVDSKQFNVSYHRVDLGAREAKSNMIRVTQLNAVPGYSYVVDEVSSLQKIEQDGFYSQATDKIILSEDSSGNISEENYVRKIFCHPSHNGMGIQSFDRDQSPGRAHYDGGSPPNPTFIFVSDVSLRTQPSTLPAPSRPPPILVDRKGDSIRLNSDSSAPKSCISEVTVDEISSHFFDVEVDGSSSAAASAVAMKEAMEKAQAKLETVKQVMLRRKDGPQCSSKPGMQNDINVVGDEKMIIDDECLVKDTRQQETHGVEHNDRRSSGKGSQGAQKDKSVLPHFEQSANVAGKPPQRKHKKKHSFFVDPISTEGTGEWKKAMQYYEFINNDNSSLATQVPIYEEYLVQGTNVYQPGSKDGKVAAFELQEDGDERIKATRKTREKGNNKVSTNSMNGAYEPEENRWKLKATKAASRQEYHEKMVKVAQAVHDTVICEHLETERRLKGASETNEHEKKLETQDQLEKHRRIDQALQRAGSDHEKCPVGQEEKDRIFREAVESEEEENKVNEVSEGEDNERRSEALEREENMIRVKEAFEREEIERNIRIAVKQKEEEKKPEKTFELEEYDKGCKEDIQEEGGKRTKEVLATEGYAVMEAWEEAQSGRNLEEAVGLPGSDKISKEAAEVEECKKHEDLGEEKNWNWPDESHEPAANDKKLEEVQERDEDEKKVKRKLEQEDFDKKSMLPCELENTGREHGFVSEQEEHYGVSKDELQIMLEGIDEEPPSCSEMGLNLPAEFLKSSTEACSPDERFVEQADRASKPEKPQKKAYAAEQEPPNRGIGKIRTGHGEEEMNALKVEDMLIDERTESTIQDNAKNKIQEIEASESVYKDDKTTKSERICVGDGKTPEEEEEEEEEISNSSPVEEFNHGEGGSTKTVGEAQVFLNQEKDKDRSASTQEVNVFNEIVRQTEPDQPLMPERKESIQKRSQPPDTNQTTERKVKITNENFTSQEKEKAERLKRERELESDRLRKLEEEREREREREKDRMAVDVATGEAHERAERAAVERATTEARQRAMAEARERLERACAEAREKSEKASMEARLRAERALVERVTAEARERAIAKAIAERANFEARGRVERSVSDKFSSYSREMGMGQSSSFCNTEKLDGGGGESAQRCKARLERHRRTVERVAKALAEKNMRDLLVQREQAERNRLAETLDADIKRWSSGKEGNLRALLSTLQYILGPDSGWQPVPLTEVITAAAVKKAYRKATLCVHPDKLQQRGASTQQKYICEKVFDLLKDAWNKFNSEER